MTAKKVHLSFNLPLRVRKALKIMALQEEKTMGEILEEMIMIKWKEFTVTDKDDAIKQSVCSATTASRNLLPQRFLDYGDDSRD